MTKKQSRRTQRALERALFGPTQTVKRRLTVQPSGKTGGLVDPIMKPGDCGLCGNICSPAEAWCCDFCGVTYLPVEVDP